MTKEVSVGLNLSSHYYLQMTMFGTAPSPGFIFCLSDSTPADGGPWCISSSILSQRKYLFEYNVQIFTCCLSSIYESIGFYT